MNIEKQCVSLLLQTLIEGLIYLSGSLSLSLSAIIPPLKFIDNLFEFEI